MILWTTRNRVRYIYRRMNLIPSGARGEPGPRLESPFLRVTRSTAYFDVLNACIFDGIHWGDWRLVGKVGQSLRSWLWLWLWLLLLWLLLLLLLLISCCPCCDGDRGGGGGVGSAFVCQLWLNSVQPPKSFFIRLLYLRTVFHLVKATGEDDQLGANWVSFRCSHWIVEFNPSSFNEAELFFLKNLPWHFWRNHRRAPQIFPSFQRSGDSQA